MLKLYHAPNSVCSQKVRVGLAVMGLEYESRIINLQRGDQFTPEYLRFNRDAVVPTLIDGDLVVVESSLILAYLDREFYHARLMPADPAGRSRAEHWLLRCIAIHAAINTLSFATANGAQIRAEKTETEIEAMAARMPDPIMGQKRKDLILNGLASPYLGQALLQVRRLLGDMQMQLSAAPWLNGEAPGIVDIALIAYVDRLDRLGLNGFWEKQFGRIGPWLKAWKKTDAYATAITAHIPAEIARATRAAGAGYWSELEKRWNPIAADEESPDA